MNNVNQALINPLMELDKLAGASAQGFLPKQDKGDPDSTMTLLSQKSASLRPDGVIRSQDGRRLLMKWEEKAESLTDAVDDLKGADCPLPWCLLQRMLCMLGFLAAACHN